jgi:hypothetical protein
MYDIQDQCQNCESDGESQQTANEIFGKLSSASVQFIVIILVGDHMHPICQKCSNTQLG